MVAGKIHNHSASFGMTVLCIYSGFVQSESGNQNGANLGVPQMVTETVEQSVQGVLNIIQGSKRGESIQFLSWDGTTLPW